MTERQEKNIVVGVTGGIAAYKSVDLIRLLQRKGFNIRVVMTANAIQFVGTATYESLTGFPAIVDMFEPVAKPEGIRHTGLADWADMVVVAPATANIIGKYANGIADDFLSTFLMACNKPLVIAPAMNPRMFNSHAVQRNLDLITSWGVVLVGPDKGVVACGHEGKGKMSSPAEIAERVTEVFGKNQDLAGCRILVTAGPTREMIDPVRFISNRSSGKMGFALAEAAVERGADVTLISGPVTLKHHIAVKRIDVSSADEMANQVQETFSNCDILIMAAAVADWRPIKPMTQKWKKVNGDQTLSLTRTLDILNHLKHIRRDNQIVIGFAAETENVIENGRKKLEQKELDGIVINDVSAENAGFEADTNIATVLLRDGTSVALPFSGKRQIADQILDIVSQNLSV